MGNFGATLGTVAMALGLIASVVAIISLIWGRSLGAEQGEGLTNTGYIATFAAFGASSVAVFILVVAFFQENFAFRYVAENHSTDVSGLSWLYKLSGLWAGREGSLLFWAWLLTMFAAYVAYKRLSITDEISNMGIMVVNVIQVLFFVSLFFEKNHPFRVSPAEWIGTNGELLVGQLGMNPLLQHWAMILHPPTLFIGYAGMAIPFAFAVAAIIVNDGSKAWVLIVDRITVFAWLFLGIGIGLGSVWAYVVLGWGGYWAWDPVENASLLPWLTGVGLIHSFTVYRRREGFKRWAVGLASVSFALVILGTFITRSGVVQSVHAFEQDWLSFAVFLTMIIASLVVGIGGAWWRGDTFKGNDDFESLTSKESAYYFNNVLMLVAALLVTYLTVTSALPSWMPGGGQSFPASTYESVARPVGILYVFIMAVCPLLAWRKTGGALFWKRMKWPLVSSAVISALLIFEWYRDLLPAFRRSDAASSQFMNVITNGEAIVGLLVAALAISTTASLFIEGARARSAAKGEGFGSSLWRILTRSRTQSGGYLTHIGIGIILVGLVGSAMFVSSYSFKIDDEEGASFSIPGYDFTYNGFTADTLPNGDQVSSLNFNIAKNGSPAGTIHPGQIQFARQEQTKLTAAVRVEALRDIFVTFEGADPATQQLQVNVKVNPLISFAWLGFLLLTIGTSLAAWPKRTSSAASA